MIDASKITMLQTCDSERYLPMLTATARVNQVYCAAHHIDYAQYIGIKRGYHPWQACFNRIVLIKEMMDAGYRGWVFYLDADAFVHDLLFDLKALMYFVHKPLIMAPGGESGEWWDVNTGVFLADLSKDAVRGLMLMWYENFMETTDEQLIKSESWWDGGIDSDQPRLHGLIQRKPSFKNALGLAPRNVLNDSKASFVRQFLKVHSATWEGRLADIREATSEVLLKSVA